MSNIAVIDRPTRSVLVDMATRYNMEPAAFEATVRATCMKPDKQGKIPTREEFAAFLLVAKEYNLNPLTKEIYAFPAKGGGIVPIVSIDGWVNLVNSHGACDGFDFDMEHDEQGKLVSCTCRMYRKDRSRPVVVTEYLSECIRDTEPWKMRHRMIRHKSLIQAARYAFGFSGIYDEDEGVKVAEVGQFTEQARLVPPSPPAPPSTPKMIEPDAPIIDEQPEAVTGENQTTEEFLTELEANLATGNSEEVVMEIWDQFDVESTLTGDDAGLQKAFDMRKARIDHLTIPFPDNLPPETAEAVRNLRG